MRRAPTVELRRERLELADGDFLDLDWTTRDTHAQTIVLILHGLEGSSRSKYASGMLAAFSKRGWMSVLMHFRGCSGEPNRAQRTYHSGETGDLQHVVDVLRSRYPDRNILCLGFSLGGNVLLKWLGEQGANAPVKAALTVSVPFDLACAANALNSGFARVYQWYLVRSLVAHLRRKFAGQTAPVDIDSVTPLSSFWHFDNQITAPLHGFADVQDYYARCSSNQFLTEIRVPTLLVQAKDDPFLPADCIPNTTQMSPCVSVEATDEGGHVGFVGRSPTTGALHYWLEERVVEHFEQWA